MEILNNILCIQKDTNTNKKHTQIFDWKIISEYNFLLPVLHKKEIKELNFKEIWDNMSIFFIKNSFQTYQKFNQKWSDFLIHFFEWYDEETGKKYNFFPKINTNKFGIIQTNLQKLWIKTNFTKENWIKTEYLKINPAEKLEEIISFLFTATIFYWNIEISNSDLKSAKIHFPLFWKYLNKKTYFTKIIQKLQENWFFIKLTETNTNDWIYIDISITDYEILQTFAFLLKPIEKIKQISKVEFVSNIKSKLLNLYPEVWNLLKNKTIKLITK